MKLKKPLILSFCFLCSFLSFGQIKVSEFIQTSEIAKQTDNALYFVDFWATWCVPCAHVSKYLTTLQKQYPNDFYIVSLSQENPEIVKRYLNKRPKLLAVAIDFEGKTFQKNNIISLPYGILYNANGEKLWEGHPAELKTYHVAKFLKQHKKTIALEKMFKAEKNKTYTRTKIYSPEQDFEYSELHNKEELFQVNYKEEFVEIKGNLQDILAYTENVYKNQLEIPVALNKQYHMYFKYKTDAYNNMTESILNELQLKQINDYANGEALVFNIKQTTFWDTNQINWGNKGEKFLIGDSEIEADNATFNKVTYTLSKLLETPIVINGDSIDKNEIHDWQIHYKYFELMSSNLSDAYGIQIEKKIIDYPQFIISKKAP